MIALLVILAFTGLFAGGPISKAVSSRDGEPLRVAYERFGHRQSQFHPVKLDLTLDDAAFQEGEARVYVDRTYLEDLQVQSISPMPNSQESGPDRTGWRRPASARRRS